MFRITLAAALLSAVPLSLATAGTLGSSVEWHSFEYDQSFGQVDMQLTACPPLFWGSWVSGSKLEKLAKTEIRSRMVQFQQQNPGAKVRPAGFNRSLETGFMRSASEGNRCSGITASYSVEIPEQAATSVVATTGSGQPLKIGIRDGYGMIAQHVDGEWVGAAPLFASAIGRELGREVSFVELDSAKARMTAPQYGIVDISISLVSATPDRAASNALSNPYFSTGMVAAAIDPESVSDVTSVSMLNDAGYTIVVADGTTAEDYVRQTFPQAELIEVSTTAGIPARIDAIRESGDDDDVLVITDEVIAASWPVMIMDFQDGRLLSSDEYVVVAKKGATDIMAAVNAAITGNDVMQMYNDLTGR